MRIGSLFAGIGGLELGLERAGVGRTAWQVESDPYASAVLAKHWPEAKRHDDVTTFPPDDGTDWSADVICGGFPCQDLSYAGKGAGIDGARSGLWREYARIVRLLRPRFVVVENVPALLSRGLGRVLGDLAACGYDAEWDCVPAAAVGANHLRDRLFLLAYSVRIGHCETCDSDTSACHEERNDQAHRQERESIANPAFASAANARNSDGSSEDVYSARRGSWDSTRQSDWWDSEPCVRRMDDELPRWVDRLKCLGNAVVPQVAEVVGRRLMEIASARGGSAQGEA